MFQTLNQNNNFMNTNKLKKAIKDFEGFADYEANELKELIIKEGYSESEAVEIIEKLQTKVVKFDLSDLEPNTKTDEDDDIVLVASESWKKYNEIENAVKGTAMLSFIQVNASPVLKTKKGVVKLIGLKLEKEKPMKQSLITVRNARLMNEQIYNTNNLPSGRFYYLIAEHFNF